MSVRGEAMPGYTGVRLGTEEGGEQKSDFRAIGGGAYGGDEAWGNPDLLVRYAHTQGFCELAEIVRNAEDTAPGVTWSTSRI